MCKFQFVFLQKKVGTTTWIQEVCSGATVCGPALKTCFRTATRTYTRKDMHQQAVPAAVLLLYARAGFSRLVWLSHPSCCESDFLLSKLLEFVRCDVPVSLTLALIVFIAVIIVVIAIILVHTHNNIEFTHMLLAGSVWCWRMRR